jgi:cytochrome c biogenesis protein CcdA
VPALWLARAPRARGLASFTLGVFAVYLAGGLVLVFGPGPALISALHHVRGPAEHVVQAVGGIVVIGIAWVVWRSRRDEHGELDAPQTRGPRRCRTRASAFALGAGIMAVELPTAFIYFGVISAILAAKVGAAPEIALLLTYNAVFVAPLLALIAIRRLAGVRADRLIAALDRNLRRAGRIALAGVTGVAGAALLTIGVAGLLLS